MSKRTIKVKANSRGVQVKAPAQHTGKLRRQSASQAVKHAAPVAAVLGAGALATAGVIMRDQLAELAHLALAEGINATKSLNLKKLLGYVGLERRRSSLSAFLPGLGMLALGLMSGAALTYWLAPGLRATLGENSPAADLPAQHNSVPSSTEAIQA
jgi:hypothetical protein